MFRRSLTRLPLSEDPRFDQIRERYDIIAAPHRHAGWWRECVLGPLELFDFTLRDRTSGHDLATATVWEMETFSNHWNRHAVGLADLVVRPEARGKGLGKFLLAQLLRHLHEQYFAVLEAHAADDNSAALGLLRGLGFTAVDAGHSFRKPANS